MQEIRKTQMQDEDSSFLHVVFCAVLANQLAFSEQFFTSLNPTFSSIQEESVGQLSYICRWPQF